MPYLISLIIAVAAALLLGVLLVRPALRARRLGRMLHVLRTHFTGRLQELAARVAALREGLRRWRRTRPTGGSGGPSAA